MFSSQSKYKLFSYDILLEDIINPFIDLVSDFLSIDKNNNWGIITAINFSSIDKPLADEIEKLKIKNKRYIEDKKLKCRNGKKPTEELKKAEEVIDDEIQRLKRWGYETINSYFINEILSSANLSKYGATKIILFDKAAKLIMTENDNMSDLLVKILSKSKLVSQLLSHTYKKGNVNFEKLTNFDNEDLYRTNTNIEQLFTLTCPAINSSYLKESLDKIPIENTDIWINERFFDKYILTEAYSPSDIIYILQDGDKPCGICAGNVSFIYIANSLALIKEENLLDYYWCLLKNNIYRIPEHKDNFKSSLVEEFNKKVKEEKFTSLLSHLKKNLYIEDVEIPEDYKQYFEDNFKINELKHLTGYELYLPYIADMESSLVGIYHTDKKPSETHYNLVHWISNHQESNKIYEFSKERPVTKNKKLVHILKPEISFYFRHKYFEDFFEEILKELGLQYVSNYKVKYKSNNNEAEYDFIIKTPEKIYIIELKTKLRNEEASKFEKKSIKLMRELPFIQEKIEFLIIGALSDENCDTYKYYIEEGKKLHVEYNSKRDGFFTIPYWFTFPMESSLNKKLTCIAEPSYERLKSIINQICI